MNNHSPNYSRTVKLDVEDVTRVITTEFPNLLYLHINLLPPISTQYVITPINHNIPNNHLPIVAGTYEPSHQRIVLQASYKGFMPFKCRQTLPARRAPNLDTHV